MTTEFHRKIIEIQKAVRQRELHRMELERELMSNARQKERNYDRLCSKLQALKLEILQDEQATNRRINGLIARVGALEKEYETTVKKTLELKAKKKQFELRRSLSNILRGPINHQTSVPERAMFDPLGLNVLKSNKETQTEHDTLSFHRNQLATPQNGREALNGQPTTSFIGRIKNQRRSSDSFLHHQRPLLQNYTPPFGSSFDNLDASILDDSFYTGRYELQSRRERTKSLGPANAPLLQHISSNYGLGGFENTFQMPFNAEKNYIKNQNIYAESVTEDAPPSAHFQGHINYSGGSRSTSEEHKAEMNYSILRDDERRLNGDQTNSKNLSTNADGEEKALTSNLKIDQNTEQQHQKQILSSKATNSNEISSSTNNQHLTSSKEEIKPKSIKLVSFSTPNLIKNDTKSLYESKERSKTSYVEPTTSIQNNILPSEIIQTSAERKNNFDLAKEENNCATSEQILKSQHDLIATQKQIVEPLELINETETKVAEIPKKLSETALESTATPRNVSGTTVTDSSNKIDEVKTDSPIDENRHSVLATKKTTVENVPLYSMETSGKDANLKDPKRIMDSEETTDSKDMTDSKHVDDFKDPRDSKPSKNAENSKVDKLMNGDENQLNSSSSKIKETSNGTKMKLNVKEKQDLDVLNTTTQKNTKALNDDADFFDEEVPLKETTAYQRMLGVLPGMGYQPPNTNDKITLNSPKAMTKIASRWGAPPDGSEGGTRPSDTESIDSVEAAIQASMSAKKVSPKENHDVDSSPELKPLPPESSPETPPSKVNFGGNKQSAKAPVKLNLDSESESYSMSAGGVSEDDDFEF